MVKFTNYFPSRNPDYVIKKVHPTVFIFLESIKIVQITGITVLRLFEAERATLKNWKITFWIK